MSTDAGLDEAATTTALQRVNDRRRSGRLPFSRHSPEQLEKMNDRLDYPPKGSPEVGNEDLEAAAGDELLSAEPLSDDEAPEAPSWKRKS